MSEKETYFKYLDNLRESGVTNMYGARPYLMGMYPELTTVLAVAILSEWMKTFAERHRSERGAD